MTEYFVLKNLNIPWPITGEEAMRLAAATSCPWEPIETAPDDRYILVFSPETPDWDGDMYVAKKFDGGFWTCGGPNGGMDLYDKFTHWMPLPKPPIRSTST